MSKSLTLEEIRQILRAQMPELRKRYGVEKMAVFGSFVRGQPEPQSDIDLLVEFEEDSSVTLLQFIALERQLGELLGRKVDLVERGPLKPAIGRRILSEAVPV